jgi:RNA polymerase sigma-70 factor, ECF subfamily
MMSDADTTDSLSGSRDRIFERLFEKYRDRVLALSWRLTGNSADADDALQETFVSVYRGLPGFRGDADVATWIHRIAIHAALRVRSRRGRCPATLTEDVPARGDTGDRLEQKEESRRVLRAMEELPTESRVVLHLFALEDMRHRQIADILGIPEGTVWSRLHRARKLLREKLREAP